MDLDRDFVETIFSILGAQFADRQMVASGDWRVNA
jgi:hypothetical protein